jgi:hypothetical protein
MVTRWSASSQRVGLGDVERTVELVDVAHDLVAAELVGRVRIDREQADRLGLATLLLPDLRPAEQQPLDAGARRSRDRRRPVGRSAPSDRR